MALDLTTEAVRLLARAPNGSWAELGAVPLAAGDVRSGIEALREHAEACGGPPVTLLLPPEQIFVRRYVLKRGSHEAQVLRRLAEDTGHRADELAVALSPAGAGELVTVLGTLHTTASEALGYARRWGFRPGRVSTRVEAERFGADGPAFTLPAPAARRAGFAVRPALAASAAILAVGLAGWGGWSTYGYLMATETPPVVVASAPELEARSAEDSADTPDMPPTRVARRQPAPAEARPPAQASPPAKLSIPAGVGAGGKARRPAGEPRLAAAAADAPASLARRSAAPDRPSAARRAEPTAAEAGADSGSLLAGIDRIRAEPSAPEDPVLVAASDIAPVTVPGRPISRPGGADVAAAASEAASSEEEGSDVLPPPADFTDSRLAAVQAPRPPARPQRPGQTGRGAAIQATGLAPPRVVRAASQRGIALDSTSLIGVIDANSGRQALLRTPSGDFLKVSRGDEVAGWRVNAIGHDAMRLTRGGETRTLLLVTR